MAPKRKAAKQGVKLANADKKQLVQDVITELQPTLSQVVEQAVKAALPDETTEMPAVTPQIDEDSDDDLEVVFNKNPRRGEPVNDSTNGSLHLHVAPAVIAKIRQNKYVKLSELLNNQDQEIACKIGPNGGLVLNRVSKAIKIVSYEQWVSAFLVFASIYAEQFRDQSAQLFKYMAQIQELYKTYGIEAAIKYDDDFRRLKEHSPIDNCKWGVLNHELYLMAAARAVQQNAQKPNFRPQNARSTTLQCPLGYCNFFATRGYCIKESCSYKHECHKCHGKHASSKCKGSSTVSTNPGNQVAGSKPRK